ncbi:MAG: DUF1841 family protein [Candidatus Aureabacteria bacterium]|nr:DUF1841 family protein [Candidatus Auribacterota bacterium]
MKDSIKEMVCVSREIICVIWERCQSGERLSAEQEHIARVLREHEQYHSAWEIGNVLVDSHYTVGGVNPFLHVHIHLGVENQLRTNDPPEVREVAAALEKGGHSRHDALHAIGAVLLDEMYDMMHGERSFDRDRYVGRVRGLLKAGGAVATE